MVPLPASLPLDDSVALINQVNQLQISDQLQNICIETLPELPCEVEIKEMNVDPILNDEAAVYERPNAKLSEMFDMDVQTKVAVPTFDTGEEMAVSKAENQIKKEEKRTSILEQVLTGNLTMNNRQKLQLKTKLTSEWWCTPCNRYYK